MQVLPIFPHPLARTQRQGTGAVAGQHQSVRWFRQPWLDVAARFLRNWRDCDVCHYLDGCKGVKLERTWRPSFSFVSLICVLLGK